MSPFRFRLKPLLDQKVKEQESAEGTLTQRRKELTAEEETLEKLKRESESLAKRYTTQRRQTLADQVGSGGNLEKRNAFLRGLAEDIEASRAGILSQKLIIGRAEYAVREADKQVAICRREVDILTKYRDKLQSKFNRELARLEELESDEIGNMLYLNRDRRL